MGEKNENLNPHPEGNVVRAEDKIPVSGKLAYSIGFAGKDCFQTITNSYLMMFLMMIAGLDGVFIGAMMLGARIWDAINDPILGSIADHTNSKWGRFRPYLFASVPVAIVFGFLFFVPGLEGTTKMVYYTIIYVLFGMGLTILEVPYFGLAGAMSFDPTERATVTAWSRIASRVTAIVLPLVLSWFLATYGDQNGYFYTAIVAGAVWGLIAGFLKANFNVNEVIAGIMLNWIGLYLTNIILGKETVMDTTKSETYDLTMVNKSALLPGFMQDLFGHNQYMTIAIPLAIVIAILILFVLEKTTFGYELKATGHNKEAARYAGMNAKRNIMLTLAISGAISGFAASMIYLTGIEHYKISSSVPGMGFNGIAVAFLGGLHPLGAILAGFFVEYITLGGQYLNTNYYNPQVADLMVSIIIYLCGFVLFFKHVFNQIGKKKEVHE